MGEKGLPRGSRNKTRSALFGSGRGAAREIGTSKPRSNASAPRPTCSSTMPNACVPFTHGNRLNQGAEEETLLKKPILSTSQSGTPDSQLKGYHLPLFCSRAYHLVFFNVHLHARMNILRKSSTSLFVKGSPYHTTGNA